MANFTDIKFYKSENNGLGGPIDLAAEIPTATPKNLFTNISRAEILTGTTQYRCFYFKNTSAERIKNFKIWLTSGTPITNTDLSFAFDGIATPYDGAIGFDGVNDYLDCGNHTDLWSRTLTKFSFSMWIYTNNAFDGTDRNVISHGGTTNEGFRCILDGTVNGRIKFIIKDSGGTNHQAHAGTFTEDDWIHVICSYDSTLGSNNMRVYVDGVGGTDHSFTGSINLSAILTIADSSNDFSGYIRDFKFWHDSAMDDDEAEQLYNDEIPTEPSYHLNFGEGTGTTTKDTVSNTKTATFVNQTFWKFNAIQISDVYDEPNDITRWYTVGEILDEGFSLAAGEKYPIWVRLTVDADADATSAKDDSAVFTIQFETVDTDSTGTPGTGGGTGGNTGGTGTIDYKIAFAGDWGCEPETDDVIDLMRDEDYDFIVGVGDNAYESAGCWTDRFDRFKDKMISAYGNHEYEESGGTSRYKSFFGDSKTYYTHRFQNILFLVMDTNDDESGVSLDEQKTFFKSELEKYKNDSRVVWRIAVCHHPWFGDGSKHSENEFDQVQKFHKMFTDYHVNFVYAGHNHHWVRSHQVAYNSSDPEMPNTVDSSSPYSGTAGGLIYIVSGTGGHDSGGSLYDLPDDESFFAYRNKSNNGVHELVATNGGRTLTGKFRNTDNDTFDTFTITA
jgi:hypothetical protein